MKILLPIDGSQHALHEVQFAIQLVRAGLQADFLLANVQEPASLYEMISMPDPEALDSISHAAGEHVLQSAQALLEEAGIAYETEVATGDPVHALVDLVECHHCDMVIMGSRGLGSIRNALQGSVSLSVLHHAPVPVLLVKPPAAPETDVEEG